MRADTGIRARWSEFTAQLAAFIERAIGEGLFRDDFPAGWSQAITIHTVTAAAHEFPDVDAAQAADFAVDTLLRGADRT